MDSRLRGNDGRGRSGSRMSALSDLRVIDLSSGIAGPFCSKLFADFGADVIKVEPPGGDASRSLGPFPDDRPDPDSSGMFIYLNRNKRGVTLDIESERGRARAADMFDDADVLLESFPPGYMDALGFRYESLEARNAGLVHVSITPFGLTGPWRDYASTELVQHAASGQSFANGSPDREPLKQPGYESAYQAGVCAFVGAMTALADRDFTGRGQFVEVSELEAAAAMFSPQILVAMHSGRTHERRSLPILPCKDGFVSLNVRHDATWEYMWLFFDDPETAYDPRYATNADRERLADEIEAKLLPHLARYTMEELFHELAPLRILIGMTLDVASLMDDPHLGERGFFAAAPLPGGGEFRLPGAPFRMSRTPAVLERPAGADGFPPARE